MTPNALDALAYALDIARDMPRKLRFDGGDPKYVTRVRIVRTWDDGVSELEVTSYPSGETTIAWSDDDDDERDDDEDVFNPYPSLRWGL